MLFTVLINMTIFVSLHWQFQIQNIFKEKNIFFQFARMKTVPAIYTLYFEILKVSPLRNVIESLHTTMRLEAIRAIQMISYNFYILEIEHFSLQHNDWHKYKIKNTLCGGKCTVLCTQTIRTTEFENYCLTIYLTNNILRRHNRIFIDK